MEEAVSHDDKLCLCEHTPVWLVARMTPSAFCLTPAICGLQPRHISFEPAWAILEHELAAQIHITMKQYFHKLKEMEPDNAFRPDTLVTHRCCIDCSKHLTKIAVGTYSCTSALNAHTDQTLPLQSLCIQTASVQAISAHKNA